MGNEIQLEENEDQWRSRRITLFCSTIIRYGVSSAGQRIRVGTGQTS